MAKVKFIPVMAFILVMGCTPEKPVQKGEVANIGAEIKQKVIGQLGEKYGNDQLALIEKGVNHAANLWRTSDGTEDEFSAFCLNQFIGNKEEKEAVFRKLDSYMEQIRGNFGEMGVALNWNMTIDNGPTHEIDKMFASYSPGAHLQNDFYSNKIAFVIALNFPYYRLSEKEELGKNWSAQEWSYARMGDIFTARVPAELGQRYAKVNAEADFYISAYNIYMGSLLDDKGSKQFPEDMVLLTHWNLRDEIKANYADKDNGLHKQKMVYKVMQRIIDQSIPKEVINSGKYNWDIENNKLFADGKEVAGNAEGAERYQQIINSFHALKAMDEYYPEMKTYIERNFSGSMEISQPEVEALFHEFLSSDEVKQVGKLIEKRLGRSLEPFDIWYDGFKSRSSISEEWLNEQTRKRYPNAPALNNDLSNFLVKLGWEKERAALIASRISVDPARGSGHALGGEMKGMNARLRTRIPANGMNYKGYNIAVHEFGHNVEQTISLHDVPYYSLNGVPNTAFTEALAFIFQSRDLFLLGVEDKNPDKDYLKTLDTFWSIYEIMGVSMVDMKVWKWLYANPDATASQLKDAVIQISKEVWNTYYSPVFGSSDEPILAIYSHMIAYPLYLSAYSFGHLIDFQIEQFLKGKDFSDEVDRIWSQGRITPQLWMERATGNRISNQPVLSSAKEAVNYFNRE